MSLPDAVIQANKEADEAAAAFDAEMKDTEETSTLEEAAGEDSDQTGQETETQDDANGAEDTIDGEEDNDEQAGEAAAGSDSGGWKQRYDTLLGKYNAEVPRLTRDLDYLRGQVEAMARNSAQRGAAIPEGSEGQSGKGKGFRRHLKKEELDEYDEDILDFQSRLARGEAESVISPVVQHLMQRIEYLEGRAQHDEQDSLWASIERQYPGAKSINDSDPLFAEFLNQTDPASGRTYKEIGEAAYASGDVGRVASLFKAYAGESGGATASPNSGKGKASPPVKPSRSGGGTIRTSPKDKPVLREREISEFFSDVAKGRYAGREDAMKKREAIIESAVLEGRVRP
jgi:hypothetical protein